MLLFLLHRLNGEKSIQMMTALVLQLVQSAVAMPDSLPNGTLVASQVQEVCCCHPAMLVIVT